MDFCHHRQLGAGLRAGGLQQPSLHVIAVAGPVDGAGAGSDGLARIGVGQVAPLPRRRGNLDLRRAGEGFVDRGNQVGAAIPRQRVPVASMQVFLHRHHGRRHLHLHRTLKPHQRRLVGVQDGGQQPVAVALPGQRPDRGRPAGCHVHWARVRVVQCQRISLAAGRAEIAHQPGDERHAVAVGRDGGLGQLLLRALGGVEHPRGAGCGVEGVELGHPPVVVAVARGRGAHEPAAVRPPIVFIDEQRGRRGPVQRAVALQDGQPLFRRGAAQLAGLRGAPLPRHPPPWWRRRWPAPPGGHPARW